MCCFQVASYEEFRDIVQASHLSPVDMKELTKNEKRNQPWNAYSSQNSSDNNNNNNNSNSTTDEKNRDDMNSSNSTDQVTCKNFVKKWRSLGSPEDKLIFLEENLSLLGAAVRLDILFNFMEEVVGVLKTGLNVGNNNNKNNNNNNNNNNSNSNNNNNSSNSALVVGVLECFVTSQRFGIAVSFLGQKEKGEIGDLLKRLGECGVDVGMLKKSFNVT